MVSRKAFVNGLQGKTECFTEIPLANFLCDFGKWQQSKVFLQPIIVGCRDRNHSLPCRFYDNTHLETFFPISPILLTFWAICVQMLQNLVSVYWEEIADCLHYILTLHLVLKTDSRNRLFKERGHLHFEFNPSYNAQWDKKENNSSIIPSKATKNH